MLSISPSARIPLQRYLIAILLLLTTLSAHPQTTFPGAQSIGFLGLRYGTENPAPTHPSVFNAVATDSTGNIYLAADEGDGVRILVFDPTATTVLKSAQFGAAGDSVTALQIDSSGGIYIAGTTASGSLPATANAAIQQPTVGGRTKSQTGFIARLDANLNLKFLSYTGGSSATLISLAVAPTGIYLTGQTHNQDLPITPSAVFQSCPATPQCNFAERFSLDGSSLSYATYLGGSNGITYLSALAVDSFGNAYISGNTTDTGLPTLNALVPEIIGPGNMAGSGFLLSLTPTGDALRFSTYLPLYLSALLIDSSGNIIMGGNSTVFPVTNPSVFSGIGATVAQLSPNATSILWSTSIADESVNALAADPSGNLWAIGAFHSYLPATPLAATGSSYAVRVNSQGIVDTTIRLPQLATSTSADGPSALTIDSSGNLLVAGGFVPSVYTGTTTGTQSLPSPLVHAPTTALPDPPTQPSAFLTRLSTTAIDSAGLTIGSLPNATLVNLGSAPVTNLTLTAAGGYTVTQPASCATLDPGDGCTAAISGTGTAGTVTIAAGASSSAFTAAIPPSASGAPAAPIRFFPPELDYDIQSPGSLPQTRTVTVTNLSSTTQTFPSALDASTDQSAQGITVSESASDCPTAGSTQPTFKKLAANTICHITLAISSTLPAGANATPISGWTIGTQDILLHTPLTGDETTLSATSLDFGTQFLPSGLSLARTLFLTNNSDQPQPHAPASLPPDQPFAVTDNCPLSLAPRSTCILKIAYLSTSASEDAATLTIDAFSVDLFGRTLPTPPAPGGTTPSLSVSPVSLDFPATTVTAISDPQTVTLKNPGTLTLPLALSLLGDFQQSTTCPAILPAAASCTITVTFAPSQPGPLRGSLFLTSALSIPLTGTGDPILAISPADPVPALLGPAILAFSATDLTQPSVQWLPIEPAIKSLSAASDGDFSVAITADTGFGPGTIATSAFSPSAAIPACRNHCWLAVQFLPSATGPRTGTLTLSSATGGSSQTLTLTGTGILTATAALTPASANLSVIPLGSTSASAFFTLANDSGQTINLGAITTTGDFKATSYCGTTLGSGAACRIGVLFAPAAIGIRTGLLTIATSLANAPALTATLQGNAIESNGLSLNPSTLAFSLNPGQNLPTQSITITNSSSITQQFSPPVWTGPSAATLPTPSSTCGKLAPNASCRITVPLPGTTGIYQLALTVTADSSPFTTLIPVTVNLPGSSIGIGATPAMTDFGPLPTGSAGPIRTTRITNTSAGPIAVTVPAIQQFATLANTCTTLAPNASCQFSSIYLPQTNGSPNAAYAVQGTSGTAPNIAQPNIAALYWTAYGLGPAQFNGPVHTPSLSTVISIPSGGSAQYPITNTGTVPLHILRLTTASPFYVTASTCPAALAPAATCELTISNLAAENPGTNPSAPVTGTLTIESDAQTSPDTLNLASTGGNGTPASHTLSISALSILLPDAVIGSNPSTSTITLSNSGNSNIAIQSLSATGDFSPDHSCEITLPPNQTCTVQITFTPSASGLRTGILQVQSDASSALEFVTLAGVAATPDLQPSATSLTFPTLDVGKSASQTIQLTNHATSALTLGPLAATSGFSASSNCPATLPASAVCNVTATFTPAAGGSLTGTLTIPNSGNAPNLQIPLTGTGNALSLSSASFTFNDVPVGSTSSPQTLTLTNLSATTPLVFSSLTLTSPFTQSTACPIAPASLPPSAACTVQITYTPSTGTNQTSAQTGTLTITPAAGPAQTVTLTGSPAAPALQITPAAVSFGTVALNSSTTQTVTIANSGNAPLTGLQLAFTGNAAFTALTDTCTGATLAPAAHCLITVRYAPAIAGSQTATLAVASNATASPVSLALTATAADFAITAATGSTLAQTVSTGETASYTLQLTPNPTSTFPGSIGLTCQPSIQIAALKCEVSPTTADLTTGAATLHVTVATATTSTARLSSRTRTLFVLALILPLGLFPRKRLHHPRNLLLIAVLAISAASLLNGCAPGGHAQTGPMTQYAPAGTYSFAITGNATGPAINGALAHTTTLSLTIN